MKALRADLLDFVAEPVFGQPSEQGVRFRPDHWLLIGDDGRIAGVRPPGWLPGPDCLAEDQRGRLLLPGFIDTHVHSAQLEVVASWGTELIDWLERHTFPAERAWRDPGFAAAGSARFLDALLAHGTTAAVVFPTVHAGSADALFQAALERGMRMVAGKVLMDRHAPDGLRDDVDGARADCLALFERWHGRGRCSGAVTVRFAPTSTPQQLAMAGELCRTDRTLVLQTHVAENRAEVAWVARLFPEARSYLDVYDRHGLLHDRTVLAHGIWFDDADRARVHDSGAQIAHCPSSNLFLGSGLFDWARARAAGCTVTLATDVGGGSSLSMPRTLADAYRVQALNGTRIDAYTLLHAATRGAALALGLGHEVGQLEAGLAADVVLWDWAQGPVAGHRDAVACGRVPPLPAQGLHERLFAWLMQADQPSVVAAWVQGRCRYRRPGVGTDKGTASC